MGPRLLGACARRRRHLELRLQHFCHDPIAELLLGNRKKLLVRAAHRVARLRVEQEVLFFHPKRIHARDNRPGGTLFHYRLDARKAAVDTSTAAVAYETLHVFRQQLGLPQREVLTFSFRDSRPTAPTTTLSPMT